MPPRAGFKGWFGVPVEPSSSAPPARTSTFGLDQLSLLPQAGHEAGGSQSRSSSLAGGSSTFRITLPHPLQTALSGMR
ncbi:MAG: hypothetical protein QXW94_02180 [Desulfurococcaceae archaeon]